MIKLDVEQLSDEWFAARCGIPSASNFDKIITSTGKKSTQADAYMNTLLAEYITGEKASFKQSDWMLRGTELEPEAREVYEFLYDVTVDQTGLVYQDERKMVSCSPDGLLDSKGLEIKCPAPGTHVGYILSGKLPTTYIQQVQGSMWVCGLDAWDFMSYHPDIKPFILTVERDDKFSKALDVIMGEFIDKLVDNREILEQKLAA
jgi:putative phage-type endonuclease